MSPMEKSDLPVVAQKRANKAASAAAEPAERRGGAKVNADLQSTVRTQSRKPCTGAGPHTRAVIGNRQGKLTALLHHINIDVLRASFSDLKKDRSAGRRRGDVDRVCKAPGGEPPGPARSRPHRGVSSAAVAPEVYTEGGRQTAAARHRCHRGQDRPGCGGCNSDADL